MISESEWLTRKKRIDSRLTPLGWRIVKFSEGIVTSSLDKVAVEELPTPSGPAAAFVLPNHRCSKDAKARSLKAKSMGRIQGME